MRITLTEADALAARAHAGQVDKGGVDYIEHPRAVAAGLEPFGVEAQMMGLFHDVLEDTAMSAEDLRAQGVPETVVSGVILLSRPEGPTYQEWVADLARRERYSGDLMVRPSYLASCGLDPLVRLPMPLLTKLADNAHNSRQDRAVEGRDMSRRYSRARQSLLAGLGGEGLTAARLVFERVNPDLLAEVPSQLDDGRWSHESNIVVRAVPLD